MSVSFYLILGCGFAGMEIEHTCWKHCKNVLCVPIKWKLHCYHQKNTNN